MIKQQGLASDNQTFTFFMPPTGILSTLYAKLAYTNGATGGGGQDIADIVSKVEIIANGNRVLFSLSGYELLKWGWQWMKGRVPQNRDARAAAVQYAMFPICFGRFPGDEEYWINLADYQLLQVNVTYAPTRSATQVAT